MDTKQPYEKPELRKLGLLRELTKFSFQPPGHNPPGFPKLPF
jgi:hypothetical protein